VEDAGRPGVLPLIKDLAQMFLGQFQHNLDEKGRLMVPARFRELLLDGGAYITQALTAV